MIVYTLFIRAYIRDCIYAVGYSRNASLHAVAVYYASFVIMNSNYSLPLISFIFFYWSFIFVICVPWIKYAVCTITMTLATFYISSTFLKMRFEQLDESIFRFKNGIEINDQKMSSIIEEHSAIARLVSEFNKSIKWILSLLRHLHLFHCAFRNL